MDDVPVHARDEGVAVPLPEVVEACTVSGAADAMLHMLARDIAHREQAIQRVREAPVIDRTESVIVLSRLLDRPRL
ncbi:Lrp/AsnC ligand binding domain-containing protein [Streptomyces angustmyceticus]|uniref:Lrp/AsnC ligand binding domain-containing protein n=1 Tax=Streptomyces angustmyceticus TaxID=285578 RepID=UPI003D9259BF